MLNSLVVDSSRYWHKFVLEKRGTNFVRLTELADERLLELAQSAGSSNSPFFNPNLILSEITAQTSSNFEYSL